MTDCKSMLNNPIYISILVLILGLIAMYLYRYYTKPMHHEQLSNPHPKDTSTYDLYGPVVADTYKHFNPDLPRLAF